MRVVGIDPGLGACGVAYCDAAGHWCTTTIRTSAKRWGRDLPGRLTHIKQGVKSFLAQHRALKPDVLVVEMMNTHDGRLTDKQDLVPLAMVAGMCMVLVPAGRVYLPLPTTWKGSIPKHIHHKRLKKQAPELIGKRVSKDAWDAVGLALYGKKMASASKHP